MIYILAVIYIVFISLGLPDSLFGVSWPVVHNEFSIDESFASVYSIITGFATGGVSFVAGKVIRKFGTSNVTFFSIFLTIIGLVGMSVAPNITVMMLFSVILGYGAGVIDTGLNNFVSLHYNSMHMNWLHCFWGVGVTLSPIIMSAFLGDDGSQWRTGYRVVALIQLVIALFVLSSLKKWKAVEKETAQSFTEEGGTHNKKAIDIICIKGVLTSVFSLGFYCSMEFLLGTWGASYAVNVFAMAPDRAAKWVSLYYGGIMVGRMLSGFISLKVSDKNMIRGGIALAFLGILVLALPLGEGSMLGFFIIGTGFGPVFPSVLHSVPQRFGAAYSADIIGYHTGVAYAVGFAVQVIYGFVATRTSFKITPFLLIALCALLFIFNEITVKKAKNNSEVNL